MKEFKEEQIFPKISGHPRDLKKNIQIRRSSIEVLYQVTMYVDAPSMIYCVYRFL